MKCSVCGKPDEEGFILCETCDEGGGHFGCLGLEVRQPPVGHLAVNTE